MSFTLTDELIASGDELTSTNSNVVLFKLKKPL